MENQLKKLLFTKQLVDTPGGEKIAEWRLSPWKVFFLLLAIMILLIIAYGYTTSNPNEFFGNVIFYAIIIIVAIAILWVIGSTAIKFRKLISGFFLAFILLFVFYWILGLILSYFNILTFTISGYALWFLITILAGIGAKRMDGNLDRNDVGYALLVFVIFLGVNLPINQHGGFLGNIDYFINLVKGWLP